jgi:tRNA (guanosine-2'-O-)-methyltransferase
VRSLGGTDLKRLHRAWRRRTGRRVALLLDSVQTPANVGSILRTAAAYRVEHLWLAGATASPASSGAARTAMGTARYLTWTEVATGEEAVAAARAAGWSVVGVELADGASPLHELVLPPAVCLAVGHEDRGLSPGVLEACDAVGFLPMLGRVGSLNVATAAAIAVYEARRQEWAGPAR